MKHSLAVALLLVSLLCAAAFGRRIAWVDTDPPPVSLSAALKLAEDALQGEKTEYHCIGASLAKTFTDGDWTLHFASKDGKTMQVSVGSDKSVKKSASGFAY